MIGGSAGFAVLSKMECLRLNWTFADKERSLSKEVRRRTDEAEYITIQWEEEECQRVSLVVTLSNREGAGGFSKRKRERERAAKEDDDGEQKGR